MISVTIEILEGDDKGRTHEMADAEPLVIGRSMSSNLQIGTHDRLVSRNHCILVIRDDKCYITDMKSRNGTLVNDIKIATQELSNMDTIRVGATLMRVIIEDVKKAICSSCGASVSEADIAFGGDEAQRLCARCWKTRIDTVVQGQCRDPIALTGLKGKSYSCSMCCADVSNIADFDGLAAEFPDSMYTCPECVKALRKSSQTYDLDDHYLILKEIGRGGMGVVYKAVHKDAGRMCALKKINAAALDDPQNIKTFEREMMVQSRVIHPNLIRIMDKAMVSRTNYFVMEYISGGSVAALIGSTQAGRLDPITACAIAIDILNGLNALHTNGFIHRDIKPSNVLLTPPGQDRVGMAKICDYGLAKSFINTASSMFDITRTHGGIAGSFMYMSPEVITNFKYAKPTVDLYSAGVTLYFMLTGKYTVDVPADYFENMGKGPSALSRHPLDIVMEDKPVPILSRNPDISRPLAGIVDRAVSKNMAYGFQDAKEFINELEAVMESEGYAQTNHKRREG
ncbi:MAG: serine/threonine-protein kinase [Candidatus Magnetominusculus sp. LBB02]|nr:serine/threonine-protein kinase [Candidatus Magnetominusculus sp. LBB02]